MLVFRAVVLVSLLGVTLCAPSSEQCDRLNAAIPIPTLQLFMLQDGMTLLFVKYNTLCSDLYHVTYISVCSHRLLIYGGVNPKDTKVSTCGIFCSLPAHRQTQVIHGEGSEGFLQFNFR